MSGHNLRTDCQRHTLVLSLNSNANAGLISVQALPVHCHYSADTDVGHGSLETIGNRVLVIMCLTWEEWSNL